MNLLVDKMLVNGEYVYPDLEYYQKVSSVSSVSAVSSRVLFIFHYFALLETLEYSTHCLKSQKLLL